MKLKGFLFFEQVFKEENSTYNKMETSELQRQYPDYLDYSFLGSEENIPKGWRPILSAFYLLVDSACNKYRENPKDSTYKRKVYVKIRRVKERYGSLKIAWGKIEIRNQRDVVLSELTQHLYKQLLDLAQEIEELSTRMCQECPYVGGEMHVDQLGWYQTLCKKCRACKNIYEPKKLKIN